MIIYKTTNLVNNKIYIGQDRHNNFKYLGSGVKILLAIKKYGKKNFKKEILKHCKTQEQLDVWERYYISQYNSCDADLGYNIIKGSSNKFGHGSPMLIRAVADRVSVLLRKHYKEHPEKIIEMSDRRRGFFKNNPKQIEVLSNIGKKLLGDKNPNYGNTWTDKQKESLRLKMLGKYDGKDNPNYGNKWNDEQRKNLADKKRKKVLVRYKNGHEKKFETIEIASKELGISRNAIILIAGGFNKKTRNGLVFEYYED